MPINKLILSISLPMMSSMLVQSLYNIVDSIYVSHLSEAALSGVTLAFPMQMIMVSAGAGMGVGVNSVLSRKLGEKDRDGASLAANNGIFLSICSYLVFLAISIFAARLFISAQTDIPEIVQSGTVYLRYVQALSFGMFGQYIFERLLQSTGKTVYSMITQMTGAIINIIIDPILIFGYFGVPAMGVLGAAVSTVIGQSTAAIIALIFNLKYNKEITINLIKYRPNLKLIGQIYAVGIPSMIMSSIGSVTSVLMNRVLLSFTSTATAVLGAYTKLQSFIFMPSYGLNNGIVPIISYNYGARNKERMMKTIRTAFIYVVCLMIVGISLMQLIPDKLFALFDASDYMLSIGVPALRTISLGFIFSGLNITTASVFQALGNGTYSMIVSAARQLIILLPIAHLLALSGKLEYVWFAYPISEIGAFVLTAFLLVRILKRVAKKD